MTEEQEILRELNHFLGKFRVEYGEDLSRRSALGLRDGLLEDLLQELSLLDEEMANDWLEYDDTDLTGELFFDGAEVSIDDWSRSAGDIVYQPWTEGPNHE